MSDVTAQNGLILANVVDEGMVQKVKADVLHQIEQIDTALRDYEQKKAELLIHRYKLEGAIGLADHILTVMATPEPVAPQPDTTNNDHEQDGA